MYVGSVGKCISVTVLQHQYRHLLISSVIIAWNVPNVEWIFKTNRITHPVTTYENCILSGVTVPSVNRLGSPAWRTWL